MYTALGDRTPTLNIVPNRTRDMNQHLCELFEPVMTHLSKPGVEWTSYGNWGTASIRLNISSWAEPSCHCPKAIGTGLLPAYIMPCPVTPLKMSTKLYSGSTSISARINHSANHYISG